MFRSCLMSVDIFIDFHFAAGATRYQVLRALTRMSFLFPFSMFNVYFSLFFSLCLLFLSFFVNILSTDVCVIGLLACKRVGQHKCGTPDDHAGVGRASRICCVVFAKSNFVSCGWLLV